MFWQSTPCCSEERQEKSKVACLIFEELRSLFWFIEDNLNEDQQNTLTLALFQKLGKFNDLQKLAEGLLEAKKKIKIAEITEDVKEEEEEKTMAEKKWEYLSEMLETIDSRSKSWVGAKAETSDWGTSTSTGWDSFTTI